MQDIFKSNQWLTSPKGYWTIQYEYQRNGVDVQYRFYWKVWISSGSWFYDKLILRLFLNGKQYDVTVKEYNEKEKGWSYEGTTGWYTVSNKTSGTVPFYAQLWDVSEHPDLLKVTSASYSLNVPPAGAMMTSAIDFTDEGNPSFTFSNPLNAPMTCWLEPNPVTLPHLCERTISGTSGTYTWQLTEDERKQLRKACKGNSCVCRIGIHSTVGSVEFDSYLDKTLTIVNANPTFTEEQISYTDVNEKLFAISGIDDDKQKMVQNKSFLSVTFGAAKGNKEATIVSYSLELNGVTKSVTENGEETYTVNFGTINSSKDVTLKITAKDSRGNTTTAEKNITVLAWSNPVLNAKIKRKNNYEDETHLNVDVSISSVDGKNSIKSLTYIYSDFDGEEQSQKTNIQTGETIVEVNKNKSYLFYIQVVDKFGSASKTLTLPKGKFPLFIDTEKEAVGINEFPEEGEALRVAGGVARFDEGIRIAAEPIADFVIAQGITDIWTWRKWNSGVYECWCEYAHNPSAIGNEGVAVDYPFDFVGMPIVTASLGRNGTLAADVVACDTAGNRNNSQKRCELFLRGITNADYEIQLLIHAMGRWK